MTRARRATDAVADSADTVLRLAVLLQAGVTPARAWGHLASSGDPAAGRIEAQLALGTPLAEAVRVAAAGARGDGWDDIAAAWEVATTVGAPLAETLRGLSVALRDAQQTTDDVRVALAEPAGTARLLGWLPLVGAGLGAALGFDTVGVLFGTLGGLACLIGGGALALAGRGWSARLVARAAPPGGVPGMGAELLAIALGGGVSVERAGDIVAHARRGHDGALASTEPDTAGILRLSTEAGVPAVELLRASAVLARHRARVEGRLAAARLSGRLLIPLGVCTLPSFVLLGVAPMLLSVFAAVPLRI
ncbi:type II secretion system F family protein [Microbacterium fluvii]|uniref:type II secretion system F family protein n=1 Tax=Microbacterium fluvii TaxID=415215 RepID=UPI0031ED306B